MMSLELRSSIRNRRDSIQFNFNNQKKIDEGTMKMKFTRWAFAMGVLALAASAGCGGLANEDKQLEQGAELTPEADRLAHEAAARTMKPIEIDVTPLVSSNTIDRTLIVDWMSDGDTLDEVVAKTGVVVRGHVVKQRFVVTVTPVWSSEKGRFETLEETGPRDAKFQMPWTISTIEVDEVLSTTDASVTKGSTVEIREIGGFHSDGSFSQVTDKPALRPQQEAVFALHQYPQAIFAHQFREAGGIQGRFTVDQGTIKPLDPKFAAFSGLPVADLTMKISTAVLHK